MTKLCPYCSEEIKLEAVKCRYCLSMLTENRPTTIDKIHSVSNKKVGLDWPEEFGKAGSWLTLFITVPVAPIAGFLFFGATGLWVGLILSVLLAISSIAKIRK